MQIEIQHQAMDNHIPVISPSDHQIPVAEPPKGFHHAHHQGQPVYAVERVYGDLTPGEINGPLRGITV